MRLLVTMVDTADQPVVAPTVIGGTVIPPDYI